MEAELSASERERYAARIERIGSDGQSRLKRTRALVIGARAAGSAAAAHLASCGVGYVAVVDGGKVTLEDLSGQALLYTPDVGANRAETVVAKLGVLNPNVHAESYPVDLETANADAIVLGHDVAIVSAAGDPDGAAAGACAAAGIPVVPADGGCAAGIEAAEGAMALFAEAVLTAQEARP